MKKFVAVGRHIGVASPRLSACCANGWISQPFYEPVSENPYLADFYADMSAWAFHSQIFFLTRRLRAALTTWRSSSTRVVQDRSVYEDAEIFAHNLFLAGHIKERDYATYREL